MPMDDFSKILEQGITFHKSPSDKEPDKKKVKTKAKKKSYYTGQHFSDSAKKKADIRKRRANRNSQRRG